MLNECFRIILSRIILLHCMTWLVPILQLYCGRISIYFITYYNVKYSTTNGHSVAFVKVCKLPSCLLALLCSSG